MTKEYDAQGRQKLATDWDAISNVPGFVLALGNAAQPGSGNWVVEYDGDTDTFFFTSSGSFAVDAADVTYSSTGSQWTAVDVAVALHDLEAAVDVLQDTVGGVVTETSGNQASFTLTGFTVNPSGTIYWVKTGNKVFVYVRADITGTSNSAVFASSSTLPASIRPAHQKVVAVPKINTGMHKGNTNNETSTPPPRKPSVRAAPIAPIMLNTGVPSNNANTSVHNAGTDMSNCKPSTGAINARGRPDNIQCATILPNTSTDSDCGAIIICSSVPSA